MSGTLFFIKTLYPRPCWKDFHRSKLQYLTEMELVRWAFIFTTHGKSLTHILCLKPSCFYLIQIQNTEHVNCMVYVKIATSTSTWWTGHRGTRTSHGESVNFSHEKIKNIGYVGYGEKDGGGCRFQAYWVPGGDRLVSLH